MVEPIECLSRTFMRRRYGMVKDIYELLPWWKKLAWRIHGYDPNEWCL